MPNITIHRCKLRIVRRGGWSWGPEPGKLLQSAISALPELIARELAKLWPDDAEVEIAAPIRISIPVKMSELLAAASMSHSDDAIYTQSSPFGMSERIAQAIQAAVEYEAVEPAASFQFEKQPGTHESESAAADGPEIWPSGAVLQSLMAWHALGVLEMRLAAFSQVALESWHRRALSGAGQSVELDPASQELLDKLVDEIAIRSRIAPGNRQYLMRLRLLALAEAMAKLHLDPTATPLREALNCALPLEGEIEEDAGSSTNIAHAVETPHKPAEREEQSIARPEPVETLSSKALPRLPRRRVKASTDIHVTSSLPFLLLGPLSRLGYLKTLAATMEAAECATETPLFAAALAYKVLAPPARGWRREPAVTEAASAFAALDEPPAAADLVAFARHLSPHLSPLDAVLSGALIEGHDANQPLLLYRAEAVAYGGFLLVDAEGNFPIAWADKLSGLRQTLIHLDSSIVLVPQATAETELLRWVDGEGFRFITDAMPTRGARWRALRPMSHERWWTNDSISGESALLRMARAMNAAVEDAETLWQSLAVERPSILSAEAATFDCHITMAASVALAAIAWELWREREQTAPHLALERFSDLGAHVHYSADDVRVSLPLGKRSQDLRDHGLLDRVDDVPWLDGRTLNFSA